MRAGDVLVADMTDPDWEPVMKRAAAIVTNRGGRTCHAAIIARELGIPAVVGCGDRDQRDPRRIRRSPFPAPRAIPGTCTTGMLEFEKRNIELDSLPHIPVKIMMNVGNPGPRVRFRGHPEQGRRSRAARVHHQPHDRRAPAGAAGVRQAERGAQGRTSASRSRATTTRSSFYVDKLAEGIAQIAAAFAPEPVIVRLSDFKSNEYANLIGGKTLRAARGESDARISRRRRATSTRRSAPASSSSAAH